LLSGPKLAKICSVYEEEEEVGFRKNTDIMRNATVINYSTVASDNLRHSESGCR